ncbi:MAG: PqqD family peptide modification chaperone [Pyrinomonadaceae bacterium]|nr:PqqD family peptide modification chaperone [Pyrinomonadaceae bacterium]
MPDEVLIYDLDRHKAICLNQSAALVRQHCNGQTSVEQIAQRLEKDLQTPISMDVVYLALDSFSKDQLLEERVMLPVEMGLNRREVMRRIGLATAVALPLVASIIAPTAAHAVTCIASGQPCSPTVVCCSTLATCTTGNCP